MPSLATKSARSRLLVRREPHWLQLGAGMHLGFRRGPDTWIAKYRDGDRQRHLKALGPFAEFTDAKDAAEQWFERMTGGARRAPKRGTVREALDAYLEQLKRQGRTSAATLIGKRFDQTVDGKLGDLALDAVTKDDFEAWRDRLVPGRAPRTVNRYVRGVVAALNAATKDLGRVGNPAAWRMSALVDDEDDDSAAREPLSAQHRQLLIEAAGDLLGAFLRGLEHTGARPGEMAAATVADFDRQGGTITFRHRKGKGSKLRARATSLSDDGVAFFEAAAGRRRGAVPLLLNPDGSSWNRDRWTKGIRAARVAVNAELEAAENEDLIPDDATAYSFRHSRISELLQLYGVDPMTVAQQTGTSMQMMEKFYFRFISSALRDKLNPKPPPP